MRAALNKFILKKLIHIASYCLRKAWKVGFEIPPLISMSGCGILASYLSKFSLITQVVLVMRVSSSLVVSFGFMAKFDTPSKDEFVVGLNCIFLLEQVFEIGPDQSDIFVCVPVHY